MQFHKSLVFAGIIALSAPVFAQSSTTNGTPGASIGATGTNETAGSNNAGVKAQGSGSSEINTNRPGTANRATGEARADQRKSGAKDHTGSTSAGAAIGATGTNETAGASAAGVKAQGSGSAELNSKPAKGAKAKAKTGASSSATGATGATTRGANESAGAGSTLGAGAAANTGSGPSMAK